MEFGTAHGLHILQCCNGKESGFGFSIFAAGLRFAAFGIDVERREEHVERADGVAGGEGDAAVDPDEGGARGRGARGGRAGRGRAGGRGARGGGPGGGGPGRREPGRRDAGDGGRLLVLLQDARVVERQAARPEQRLHVQGVAAEPSLDRYHGVLRVFAHVL